MDVIWVEREQEYFCRQGWTAKSVICPSGSPDNGWSVFRFALTRNGWRVSDIEMAIFEKLRAKLFVSWDRSRRTGTAARKPYGHDRAEDCNTKRRAVSMYQQRSRFTRAIVQLSIRRNVCDRGACVRSTPSPVITREGGGFLYAAAFRFNPNRFWNTGSPAFVLGAFAALPAPLGSLPDCWGLRHWPVQ
jgi:hypothetical protein